MRWGLFVCGPTGFVEAVANLLADRRYAPDWCSAIATSKPGP